jgi:hypothetical protein
MKIHEVITEAQWCKFTMARDVNDKAVNRDDPNAVKWCALGWVAKCYPVIGLKSQIQAEFITAYNIPIHSWNDKPERTFGEVLEMFTKLDI